MGHHHHHSHSSESDANRDTRKRLWVAFLLNFFFTIIEFIGGAYTNSIAIISDAVHDLGDTIAIGSALWLEKIAQRKSNSRYTYGYKRFSTLGALITSVILLAGSIIIIYEAIPRLFKPQEVMATGMIWMAVLGIVFNGIAVLRLRGGSESLNNRAVMFHLLEDALGWVAVLIGGTIIYYTEWYWIDPILSLAVASFILYNVIGNLKSIMRVFLQSTPKDCEVNEIESFLLALHGVVEVHDIHSWTMDGNYNVMSIHIVVNGELSKDTIVCIRSRASKILKWHGIHHPTIAIEFENEVCDRCM